MTIDLEYIAARSVLLDAIGALGSQADSFILVGAQGVYAHTGNVAGTGSNRTTDADLALNTELLESDPELTSALEAAGFTATGQPGSWAGSRGIRVDIMTVPHQSNPKNHTSRSARLPPHGTNLARITAGLEAALIDNSKLSIEPLSTADPRSVEIAVAGPAALLVAKASRSASGTPRPEQARRTERRPRTAWTVSGSSGPSRPRTSFQASTATATAPRLRQ